MIETLPTVYFRWQDCLQNCASLSHALMPGPFDLAEHKRLQESSSQAQLIMQTLSDWATRPGSLPVWNRRPRQQQNRDCDRRRFHQNPPTLLPRRALLTQMERLSQPPGWKIRLSLEKSISGILCPLLHSFRRPVGRPAADINETD
jgi:hypothetical protein